MGPVLVRVIEDLDGGVDRCREPLTPQGVWLRLDAGGGSRRRSRGRQRISPWAMTYRFHAAQFATLHPECNKGASAGGLASVPRLVQGFQPGQTRSGGDVGGRAWALKTLEGQFLGSCCSLATGPKANAW